MFTIGCGCSFSYLALKYRTPVLVPSSQARMLCHRDPDVGLSAGEDPGGAETVDDRRRAG